jgi:presenilin-like A22 family membrane protease
MFLIITFGISIYAIIKNRNRLLSIINSVIVISVPFISFVNSIGRTAENEFQHLIISLKQGNLWAIYALTGYLFILLWWLLFSMGGPNKEGAK